MLCVKLSSGFGCCFVGFFLLLLLLFNYKYMRPAELSLSVELICQDGKAAGTGFGSATGKENLSIHMKRWNSNWNICFSQQAPRASLRIKLPAKFSLVSLESVSGVIRSGHLWREWRLSRGSLSPEPWQAPVLQHSWELGIFCGPRDIVGFFRGREKPALISLFTDRSWTAPTGQENG